MHQVWTEWHLTPCGWVRGSEKTEMGSVFDVAPAAERVLTCRYREIGDGTDSVEKSELEETWRMGDPDKVGKLLQVFGECPRAL